MNNMERVRFQYIKDNQDNLYIKKACKTLNVSRSDYYKYLYHKPSKRDMKNEVLKEIIREIFEKHKVRYGSLRIAKVLEQREIHVNRKCVLRLLREMNLVSKGTRYHYRKYNQKASGEGIANLLNQVFITNAKNKIWVGDFTI